jgi:hypothetical protein
MMLMSSISDVGWCCWKWVENRRSSNAELGVGGHVRIGRCTSDAIDDRR